MNPPSPYSCLKITSPSSLALAVMLDWKFFSRLVVGVYRDAKELHGQQDKQDSVNYDMGLARLEERLLVISHSSWENLEAQRLAKRI